MESLFEPNLESSAAPTLARIGSGVEQRPGDEVTPFGDAPHRHCPRRHINFERKTHMFKIVEVRLLAPGIKRFVIEAPRIARKQKPGQFAIVRIYERGERIPLTIERSDLAAGTISLVAQSVGKTTHLLNSLDAGDDLLDVVGPLGKPSVIEKFGSVVVIGGGVGVAMAYPTAEALKKVGNCLHVIVGARTKELIILEPELRAITDELWITTDDGSYGEKGIVTDRLARLVQDGVPIDMVLAVGPVRMMKAVAEITRKAHISTVVSLNPIMIDGTGMCGGCRVLVDGESKFACVDGPEFDAHRVNFDVLLQRNSTYREAENQSFAAFQEDADAQVKQIRESNQLHVAEATKS
jgi:ferredoxin/flavodoxin---NADP+ reductase